MSFHENLITLIKTNDAFVDMEGDLLQSAVIDAAHKINPDLIKLLISDPAIKKKFFSEIAEHRVFDINTFVDYVADKNFLNDSYTKFKNKIGLTIDGKSLRERGEVALVRPYKDCILEGGMTKEDQKRKEIFFNQVLAQDEIDKLLEPKVLTNRKRYTTQGKQAVGEIKRDEEGTIRENLIIKGNNLLALHSLKKEFAGKVKLIYIDPPYNTGSDGFKYNDNFNHSTWLTFMKNRLDVAKELLITDGIIFVQCDDNEQAYLKVLMDDIFSQENNISVIYVETVYAEKTLKQDRIFHDQIEQILVYAKNGLPDIKQDLEDYSYDKFFRGIKEVGNPSEIIELDGKKVEIFNEGDYQITQQEPSINGLKEIRASGTILDMNSSGRFFRDNLMDRIEIDGYGNLYKVYGIGDDESDFRYFTGPKKKGATKGKYYQGVPKDKMNIDVKHVKKKSIENFRPMAGDFGNCRSEGGVEFKSGKKPEKLLKKIIDMSTKTGDIVLDYHLGSGTTAAVAHKMGRQYIGIEQIDYDQSDSVVRLQNVIKGDTTGISKEIDRKGGGDFIYCELAKYNENFIDRIQEVPDTNALLTIREEMKAKSFLDRNVDLSELETAMEEFVELSLDEQKQSLVGLLNKNQLYINLSDLNNQDFSIPAEDKELNRKFYQL